MKVLSKISRLLVGSLFIVSGLIKANDPTGFAYKLQEYFAPGVLDWPIFDPIALELAVFICVIEIVLGFATLLGAKMKLVSWSLLGMITFFTFLTFYSAYFNKVTDCGCFGDALKLTPWESFTKDVVLFVLIIIIMAGGYKTELNTFKQNVFYGIGGAICVAFFSFSVVHWSFPFYFFLAVFAFLILADRILKFKGKEWVLGILTAAISLYFSWHCLKHLPVKDFRPFAVGKNIEDGMYMPPDAKADVYETVLTYKNKNTGEEKDFSQSNYPWKDTLNWLFVKMDSKLVEEGYHPPIHDFNPLLEGTDVLEDILQEPYLFLFVAQDIEKAKDFDQKKVEHLVNEIFNSGYYIYGLTSTSDQNVIEEFRHQNQLAFDFLINDETAIKTMIRSNPGLVMLRKGTVVGKWSYADLPTFEQVKELTN